MKTTTRSIPNDLLSVEEGNRHIQISTHRDDLIITLSEGGIIRASVPYSFNDVYTALQALLTGPPLSCPSSADKEAATGHCEPRNGGVE